MNTTTTLRTLSRFGASILCSLTLLSSGCIAPVDEDIEDELEEETDEQESALVSGSVKIDFGTTTVAVPTGWNDAQGLIRSGRMALKDANGKQTLYSLHVVTPWNTTHPYGTTTSSTTLGLPKATTQDGVYGNVLSWMEFASPKAAMELRGLNPDVSYTIQFFASVKKNDTWNRDTRYRLVGATTVTGNLNPTNNDTKVVKLTAKPNASGTIRVEVEKGAANDTTHGFYHLANMVVSYGLPDPGAQRLVRKDTTEFSVKPPNGYAEYLPSQYVKTNTTKKWPLLIALHGIGEVGNGTTQVTKLLNSWSGLPRMINEGKFPAHDRFIVLAPQHTSTAVMTPAQVRTFLTWAKANYNVDTSRMYLTGLSLGGRAVWDYVSAYGSGTEFAAVSVTPGDGAFDNPLNCVNAGRVPMWAFQGGADTNYFTSPAHAIGGYNAVKNCSTKPVEAPRLTIFDGITHNSWWITYDLTGMARAVDPAYTRYDEDLYSWMLAHKRVAN